MRARIRQRDDLLQTYLQQQMRLRDCRDDLLKRSLQKLLATIGHALHTLRSMASCCGLPSPLEGEGQGVRAGSGDFAAALVGFARRVRKRW
jgi:hypothetical protein